MEGYSRAGHATSIATSEKSAVKADDRTRTIPVVVLTSSSQERDVAECYQLGVNSYVQKPADLREFRETVRRCYAYWLNVNQAALTAF
jgi:two-component system, response regulator